MKNIITTIILIIGFSQCTYAQKEILLDTQKSQIYWMGSKFLGFNNHHGTVQFSEGKLITNEDKITGGDFVINMHTIANIDGGYNDGLVKHLKDRDFFDVPSHPTATLVITKIDYEDGTHLKTQADLTIKGVTMPIEYTAEIDYEQRKMTADFSIDRTRWNITFGSQLITSIKDHIISDEIEFKVALRF